MVAIVTKRDARSLDHAALEEMRRLGVSRVLAGESQVAVAESLQVNLHTVSKWVRKYREGGAEALASTKAPGRRRTLTQKQQQRLRRIIIGKVRVHGVIRITEGIGWFFSELAQACSRNENTLRPCLRSVWTTVMTRSA
jgi:transposase